jgi:hypothetical protein
MACLLYLFVAQSRIENGLLCFFLLFLFFELPFLLMIQFTTTAFVAVQAGLFLILFPPDRTRNDRVWVVATGLGLCVLGTLVREKVLYLVLILSAPVVIYTYAITRSKHILIVLPLTVALCGGAILYDRHFYASDPGWRAFLEYNKLRGSIHDTPAPPYNEHTLSVLKGIGWSLNDLSMFNAWFFPDPDIYSKDNLGVVSKLSSVQRKTTEQTWRDLKTTFGCLGLYLWFTALNVVLCLFLFQEKRSCFAVFAGFNSLLAFSICWFLAFAMKLPERVSVPIIFFMNTTMLLFSVYSNAKTDHALISAKGRFVRLSQRVLLGLVLLLYAGLAIHHLKGLSSRNIANAHEHAAFRELVRLLSHRFESPAGAPPKFFAVGASFPYEWAPPLSRFHELKEIPVLPFGWNTHSPTHQTMLRHNGIENVYRDLYEKENSYLISSVQFPSHLGRFVKEHFGEEIQFHDLSGRLASDNPLITKYTRAVGVYKVYRNPERPSP